MAKLERNCENRGGVLVCRSCVKLWIADVLSISIHPTSSSVYMFQSLNLTKVDICGVVTECAQSGTSTVFRVDDTTGSIQCRLNYKRFVPKNAKMTEFERMFERFKTSRASSSQSPHDREVEAISNILLGAKERSPSQGKFKVGDVVRVCGFISDYFEHRTLNAFDVSDPLPENDDLSRRCGMVMLYKQVYGMSGRSEEMQPSRAQGENSCILSPHTIKHFLLDTPMEDDYFQSLATTSGENRPGTSTVVDVAHKPKTKDNASSKD